MKDVGRWGRGEKEDDTDGFGWKVTVYCRFQFESFALVRQRLDWNGTS